MTRLGISTFACTWAIGGPGQPQPAHPLDHPGFLRRCAEYGVHVAQIADNLPLHTLDDAALSALAAEARRLNLALEVGARGIAPDLLRRYLEITQRCGSPFLRVVIDTADRHPDTNEVIDTLRPLLPAFEQAGVVLAIENHDRFKVRELLHILDALDNRAVGICLDTANSFGAMEGVEVVVEVLGPHIVNLHLKDFVIRRASHNMGFALTGVPAGQGMLDIPWLLGRLNQFGRDFNAIIELWTPPEADLEATIRKEAEWLVQTVTHLRTIIPD